MYSVYIIFYFDVIFDTSGILFLYYNYLGRYRYVLILKVYSNILTFNFRSNENSHILNINKIIIETKNIL